MSKELKIELLEPQKLVSVNKLPEITNPIFFVREGVPTEDGLLSNEIFGITKADRSNRFAYIDLHEWFLHPYIYKIWKSMDRNIVECVYGTKKFKLDSKGYLVEDENGKTGLKFLKSISKEVKFRSTDSSKRDTKIKVLEKYRDNLFINKLIVIPAYYRDVQSTGRKGVGVGEINKMYASALLSVRSLKDTADYGIDMSNGVRARIQQNLVNIYDWFTKEPNLAKKNGIIRRSVLSKTSDYASRLIISAPSIDAERYTDLMVDMDYSAVPLASVCSNLYPFIIFNMRRFFENELSSGQYPVLNKDGEVTYEKIKDFNDAFSDEKIKKQVDRYIKGFSNRLIPIEIPLENGKTVTMEFKGKGVRPEDVDKPGEGITLPSRAFTWLDVIYLAAVDAARDKHVLITRYPLEDYFGQFPTKIRISTTKKTEPIIIGSQVYKFYPYIRQEMIGTNTSNMFIDTLQISNLYLKAIGGDYDGDQVTVKAAYSIESNAELDKSTQSKYHYLSISGENIRTSSNEAIQATYSFTKVLNDSKLTDPKF